MLIIINAGQFCSLKQYKTIWGFSLKNTCCVPNLIIIIYDGFVCKEQGFPKENHPLPQLCLLSTNYKAEQIRTRYLQPGRRDVTENLIWIFHAAVLICKNPFGLSLQHLWESHQDVWVLLSKYDCDYTSRASLLQQCLPAENTTGLASHSAK